MKVPHFQYSILTGGCLTLATLLATILDCGFAFSPPLMPILGGAVRDAGCVAGRLDKPPSRLAFGKRIRRRNVKYIGPHACSNTAAGEAETERWEHFDKWLSRNGVDTSWLALDVSPSGLRGVAARREILSGTTVLRIPLSLCLLDPSLPRAGSGLEGLSPEALHAWWALPWQVQTRHLVPDNRRRPRNIYRGVVGQGSHRTLIRRASPPISRLSERRARARVLHRTSPFSTRNPPPDPPLPAYHCGRGLPIGTNSQAHARIMVVSADGRLRFVGLLLPCQLVGTRRRCVSCRTRLCSRRPRHLSSGNTGSSTTSHWCTCSFLPRSPQRAPHAVSFSGLSAPSSRVRCASDQRTGAPNKPVQQHWRKRWRRARSAAPTLARAQKRRRCALSSRCSTWQIIAGTRPPAHAPACLTHVLCPCKFDGVRGHRMRRR